MKTIFLFLGLVISISASAAQIRGQNIWPGKQAISGNTFYLHLAGKTDYPVEGSLLAELEDKFAKVLNEQKNDLNFSYVATTQGGTQFNLNLILEPRSEQALPALQEYLVSHNGIFHGTEIHFMKVEKILERAVLEAGNYNDALEDPFVQSFSLERSYAFSDLAGWESFTNQYGKALLNPVRSDFLAYLEAFVSDKAEFTHVRDHVLTVSDMMAIEPIPYLILEGNRVAGPEWDFTPFVPFKFFRNCYSARFEGGVCYRP
ncbi:MAG: hypothetical protein ACXVBE_17395 [Bdellovibrionota bacterium]